MWQVLFYVTPLTVGLVLVALLVGAFYLARSELSSDTGLPQGLLAACTLLFLLVIAAPLGQWDRVGTHTRDLDWDPVADISEAFAGPGSHGHVSTEPIDGHLAHHAREKRPEGERAEFHGLHGTAFFLQGEPGQVEVLAPERNEVSRHLLNLLLFVPVGILAFYAFTQWWARLFFGPALSVSVESIQWAMAAGSIADPADVVFNTVGFLVGTVIAVVSLCAARWAHTGGTEPSERPLHPAVE